MRKLSAQSVARRLSVAVLVTIIAVAGLSAYQAFWPHHATTTTAVLADEVADSSPSGDQAAMRYEIFRDLLVVMVGAGALIGALAGGLLYLVLRGTLVRDVSASVTKRVDKQCRQLAGQTDIQAGVTYWAQGMYDHAIDRTQRALYAAGDVLDEIQVTFAKSNLAFYYADQHKADTAWHLKDEALKLAKIGYDKYSPSIDAFKKADWVDNYMYVRAVFLRSMKERDTLLVEIEELLSRRDLQSIHGYLQGSKDIALKFQ